MASADFFGLTRCIIAKRAVWSDGSGPVRSLEIGLFDLAPGRIRYGTTQLSLPSAPHRQVNNMHISKLKVKNFRGLEDIEFVPGSGINVLVGPNAVGKTSVLEAIRLTKALLAPRYREEVTQVLQSLGAATPHMMFGEQQIDFTALAGNETKALDISVELSLSQREIGVLESNEPQLAQAMVRSRIGQERQTQLDLIQYMSSTQGQDQLRAAGRDTKQYLEGLKTTSRLTLGLSMQPMGNGLQINSKDTLAQLIVQGLEGACPPQSALVSYFPADRPNCLPAINSSHLVVGQKSRKTSFGSRKPRGEANLSV